VPDACCGFELVENVAVVDFSFDLVIEAEGLSRELFPAGGAGKPGDLAVGLAMVGAVPAVPPCGKRVEVIGAGLVRAKWGVSDHTSSPFKVMVL
jgi:hypothetical protein